MHTYNISTSLCICKYMCAHTLAKMLNVNMYIYICTYIYMVFFNDGISAFSNIYCPSHKRLGFLYF